jgi:hypothetical protein
MNRIAAIKSLIAIASALEKRGMIAEASVLDQVMRRLASIENEGGLQGDYLVSPKLIGDLGEYDPYSLSQLSEQSPTLSPGYQRAEEMVDGMMDRFQENDIYDGENPEEIDPDEKEMRELAKRWSSGPGSALFGLAYTGLVYSLDQREELLNELDQAIDHNNDPEEHMRLQTLKAHVATSVPIMTENGVDNVTHIEYQVEMDDAGGQNIYLLFKTEQGTAGMAHIYKTKDQQWKFMEVGSMVDGRYQSCNSSEEQIGQLASALYDKYFAELGIS